MGLCKADWSARPTVIQQETTDDLFCSTDHSEAKGADRARLTRNQSFIPAVLSPSGNANAEAALRAFRLLFEQMGLDGQFALAQLEWRGFYIARPRYVFRGAEPTSRHSMVATS